VSGLLEAVPPVPRAPHLWLASWLVKVTPGLGLVAVAPRPSPASRLVEAAPPTPVAEPGIFESPGATISRANMHMTILYITYI
jgi:hypothetical protein